MKTYSKREINNMILTESMDCVIFEKKELQLREDTNSNSYVEPSSSSNGVSSLTNDLNKAKANNPHDEEFVVNASSYDTNQSNNNITLDITGNNANDASKKFQTLTKNPNVRNMIQKGNVNAKFHLNKESLCRLRETSVPFSKKELQEMLKR